MFIVQAPVAMIVNYNCKMFIVQATGKERRNLELLMIISSKFSKISRYVCCSQTNKRIKIARFNGR